MLATTRNRVRWSQPSRVKGKVLRYERMKLHAHGTCMLHVCTQVFSATLWVGHPSFDQWPVLHFAVFGRSAAISGSLRAAFLRDGARGRSLLVVKQWCSGLYEKSRRRKEGSGNMVADDRVRPFHCTTMTILCESTRLPSQFMSFSRWMRTAYGMVSYLAASIFAHIHTPKTFTHRRSISELLHNLLILSKVKVYPP